MLKIDLDIRPLVAGYNVSRQEVLDLAQRTVEVVTWNLYNEIHKVASNDLRRTRDLYVRNLNQPEFGRLTGTIVLTGSLPNMIESGATAFDMKQGFSKSTKKKQKKDGGWFLTIPFRWATPGSIADSPAFSMVMPQEVYEIAKGLKGGRTSFMGMKRTSRGITGAELSKTPFGSSGMRAGFSSLETGVTHKEYRHRAPLAQGMIKQSMFYESAMQSKYMTFRRVSDRSDKNSWIHPGISARKFFDQAIRSLDISTIVANTVDNELEILGL